MQVFDYPNNTNSGVNFNSWFVNDMINLTPQLTLNAGVRFDRYSRGCRNRATPAPGRSPTPNIYPENHDFPTYNAWSPRLSLIYDLTGNGRVALKASYGRYAASGSGVDRRRAARSPATSIPPRRAPRPIAGTAPFPTCRTRPTCSRSPADAAIGGSIRT